MSFRQALVRLACALLLISTLPALARAEEYLLQAGDVLSFKIIGPAELEQSVRIEMDGTAWFPIIGEIQAADSTLRQIRQHVVDAYSVTSFPTTASSETMPQLIPASQVYVGIESYRPIYVAGDIPQPVILDFRPGMTLRKAVVLASAGMTPERPDIVVREREDAVALNLARAYARIWSLKTLLGTATPQDRDNIRVADSADIDRIVELEQSLIAARKDDLERQRRTIGDNIKRSKMRLAALIKQKANEEEGLALDEKVVADLRKLAAKGLAVASRLAEVRRAAISSAGSVLQIDATIEEVRTDLAALEAEAEAIEEEAQSAAWAELSETIGTVHDLRADLATLRAVSAATAFTRTRIAAVITRDGETLPPVDMGSADQELYPGDLVEILITTTAKSQG